MDFTQLYKAPLNKWRNLSKWKKVGTAAALSGVAVIALPFAVKSICAVSIVKALCIIGGWLGCYGVAGGIIVTASGVTLSSSLAAVVTQKFADDPELIALQENYAGLETLVREKFVRLQDELKKAIKERGRNKRLKELLEMSKSSWKRYLKAAERCANILKGLEDDGSYEIDDVRKANSDMALATDELNEFYASMKAEGFEV